MSSSIQEVTYYKGVCAWPGCGKELGETSDYSAWSSPDDVIADASEAGWWEGREGNTIYCNDHPTTWASDHEHDEPYPESPYLLVHDGDTHDPMDDGKVSVIVKIEARAVKWASPDDDLGDVIRIGSQEFRLTDGIYRSATGSTWTVDAVHRYTARHPEMVEVIYS